MIFRSRCSPNNDVPFFRIVLSFRSMLTINRYCQTLKILTFIRSYFSLAKSFLPIILHEVITDEEIILTNETILSEPINAGIYLVLLKYDEMKYQPLIDINLIPMEIFPEKIFLPKSMPFIINEIHPFVKTLSNVIDYMKDYEKIGIIYQKYTNNIKNESNNQSLLLNIGQMSTAQRPCKDPVFVLSFFLVINYLGHSKSIDISN